MDEKPIKAADLVKNPELIYEFQNEYIMLKDTSILGQYKNLIDAINILSEYGWESLGLASDGGGSMYTLCRNIHYKRKNTQ